MKLHNFVVLAALFLAANAVPAKRTFFTSHPKDLGTSLVRIPVAHFKGGGCIQSGGPTSPPTTGTFAPTTATTATATTATATTATETTTTATSTNEPSSSVSGPPSGTGSCESCSVENFNLVNQYRASRGLSQIGWSDILADLAAGWSKRMYDTRVFEHSDYPYWENIAWAYNRHTWATAASGFFESWRKSPGHDQNMRLPSHVCMGVGIYGDGSTLYATQIFSNNCP